jgi:glycosyltransferase involved in cell wall biosynthesis
MGSDIRARAEEVVGRSVDPNRVRVGLIMPFYNEAASLAETLASIAAQTFDHRRIYLIAVDGASTDGGAAVIQRWFAQSDIGGIVANNTQRRIPISLNIGIRQLDVEDLVVRLDAHTTYGPTYIADIVAAFAAGPADLGCVGGGQLPEPAGLSRRAFRACC